MGLYHTAPASTAWPASNRAIFVPVRLDRQVTVYKMVAGGGVTATGNYDVGIYDRFGNRLVSSGATAKPSSAETVFDVTDTPIGPGLYYLAMAADGTQNIICFAPSIQVARAAGILQMATAYTLPDPATYAACAAAVVPAIAAYFRSY